MIAIRSSKKRSFQEAGKGNANCFESGGKGGKERITPSSGFVDRRIGSRGIGTRRQCQELKNVQESLDRMKESDSVWNVRADSKNLYGRLESN
jgi:hypothetical protein